MEVFRSAMRRAEEEQGLVTRSNTALETVNPAAEDTPRPEEPATEPCDCIGCTLRATFTKMLKEAYEPLGMAVSEPTTDPLEPFEPFEVNVIPLNTRRWGVPLTREEEDRLVRATEEAFGGLNLIAAGVDFAILTGPAPMDPTAFRPADSTAAAFARLRERAEAMIRQWEADGRPLNVVTPPKPSKVTLGLGLTAPIDQASLMFSLREEERRNRLHREQVRRAFPPKV
ncbi:hypothetical protein OOK36_54755 [Streptomyces sp. NBC_00365]|uniref:hypothetical protein n=1 Tax=Streptomyces sp. NBC_00365 TaxID=2975726 RepID=UPI0022597742|nr:hypothetical protein [Streptomyces sp. NBC_00365]MCX5097532.1 hypothetical protein [Streptomyces sp. NBC_00365]